MVWFRKKGSLSQFENGEKVSVEVRPNPGNLKRRRFVEEEQARRQRDLPDRPAGILYHETMMLDPAPPHGNKPRIGLYCNMIPPEIVWALGAEPVRLDCGNSAAATSGEEMLSGEICPVAKSSFGNMLDPNSLAASCDALVIPTSCDAKRKMGGILDAFKPTFMYNLPAEQNHTLYAEACLRETKRLIGFLEPICGVRLERRRLRQAVELGRRRTHLIRELQAQRIANPRCLAPSDLFLVVQSSMFRPVDWEEWLSRTATLVAEIRGREVGRRSLRPRLVLTGAPMAWPNFKVLNVLEECGADVVADTLCTGAQSCFDPVVCDEGSLDALLRAVGNRSVFASICPCFVSQRTRLNRVLDLVEAGSADGVVNYCLRLCQLFDLENFVLERTLKSRKIPYHTVRTDYSQEDTEQIRVRIEAFLETLG